jgi:hypothetical protein
LEVRYDADQQATYDLLLAAGVLPDAREVT